MYKISNFSSLWEIGFAINAVFVFFELQPFLENKFKGMQSIGTDIINKFIRLEDQRYVNTYGWRSLVFGYATWLGRLKLYSVLCSLMSLVLIIVGGFNPDFSFGIFGISTLIVIQFFPIVFISYIILYYLPKYKILCIEEATIKLIEMYQNDNNFIINHMKQYKYLVNYIIVFRPLFSKKIKTKNEISYQEPFELFDEFKSNKANAADAKSRAAD
jgi:hypothetical protein